MSEPARKIIEIDSRRPDKDLTRNWYQYRRVLRKALTPQEYVVLEVVEDFANKDSGWSWPSYETIQDACGISRTTSYKAIKLLRKLGILVTRGRPGRSSEHKPVTRETLTSELIQKITRYTHSLIKQEISRREKRQTRATSERVQDSQLADRSLLLASKPPLTRSPHERVQTIQPETTCTPAIPVHEITAISGANSIHLASKLPQTHSSDERVQGSQGVCTHTPEIPEIPVHDMLSLNSTHSAANKPDFEPNSTQSHSPNEQVAPIHELSANSSINPTHLSTDKETSELKSSQTHSFNERVRDDQSVATTHSLNAPPPVPQTYPIGTNSNVTNLNTDNISKAVALGSNPATRLIVQLKEEFQKAQKGEGNSGHTSRDTTGVIGKAFRITFAQEPVYPRLQKMAKELEDGWELVKLILRCTGYEVEYDPHNYLQKMVSQTLERKNNGYRNKLGGIRPGARETKADFLANPGNEGRLSKEEFYRN